MSLKTRRVSIGIAVLVLAVGVTVWGLTRSPEEQSTLPEELSVASLRERMQQGPEQMGQTMREQENLSEQQRRELRRNMGQAWRSLMRERLDEYFNATPEEQVAVLDRHIDEFQERMKEWRERREERRREQADDADRERQREEWRARMREMRGGATSEQRKARSENRDPDEMARGIAYFEALRKRMAERGIEGPRGPGGGFRGGPPGGPGGRPPGGGPRGGGG